MAGPLYYLSAGSKCAQDVGGAAEEQGNQAGAAEPHQGLETFARLDGEGQDQEDGGDDEQG
jgi:hypothetical protein